MLSLRIRHPSLDPLELSRELGIEPVHCFRAGDPRSSRSGIAPASVHRESYWLGALNAAARWPADLLSTGSRLLEKVQEQFGAASARTLGAALSLSVRQFFTAHAERLRRIQHEGGQVSLLVAVSPEEVSGFSLTPDVTRVLGELGVSIEFELATD
jgi:hypothetical protein